MFDMFELKVNEVCNCVVESSQMVLGFKRGRCMIKIFRGVQGW